MVCYIRVEQPFPGGILYSPIIGQLLLHRSSMLAWPLHCYRGRLYQDNTPCFQVHPLGLWSRWPEQWFLRGAVIRIVTLAVTLKTFSIFCWALLERVGYGYRSGQNAIVKNGYHFLSCLQLSVIYWSSNIISEVWYGISELQYHIGHPI